MKPLTRIVCTWCVCALAAAVPWSPAAGDEVAIRSCAVRAEISGRLASTTVDLVLVNYTDREQEMTFQWRMSDDATVGDLAMWVGGLRSPAEIHPRTSARMIYEEIVAARRDPALLEYLGEGRWQLRVFPVPPQGTQKVQLVCRQLLRAPKGWIRYAAPTLAYGTATKAQDFDFAATISDPAGVRDLKAGRHRLGVQIPAPGAFTVGFRREGFDLTNTVDFSFLPAAAPAGAEVVDGEKGRHFAAVLPAPGAGGKAGRCFVLVVDRSGSMKGNPFDLAVLAAQTVMEKLAPADSFALVLAGADAELWKAKPVRATKENLAAAWKHLTSARPEGGTDLAAALRAAEGLNTDGDRPFFICLFSDGQDVVGAGRGKDVKSAKKADKPAKKADKPAKKADKPAGLAANCRIFALDLGDCGPGLHALAELPRTHVEWAEDEEEAANAVGRFLAEAGRLPFKDPRVELVEDGGPAARDLCLSQVIHNNEIVLAGRCTRAGTIKVKVSAKLFGKRLQATHEVTVPPAADAGARPEWTKAALTQVWAHLKAEQTWRGLRRQGGRPSQLEAVMALSRTHRVPTSATAFLILESDADYARRGIQRRLSVLAASQTLSQAAGDRAKPASAKPLGERALRLRAHARELRRLGQYAKAAELLERIADEHPGNTAARDEAAVLREFVELCESLRAEGRTRGARDWHGLLAPADVRWSAVPWYQILRYPRDWPRPTATRPAAGADRPIEGQADRAVRKALRQALPKVEFDAIPLEDVVQFLRDVSNVNIHVKWATLRSAGIEPKAPVNVRLRQVSVEKALRTVLEDVGGAAEPGFVVDEGLITISTREDLSRQTVTRVYDVRDMITIVPTFTAPRISALRVQGESEGGPFGGGAWGDDGEESVGRTLGKSGPPGGVPRGFVPATGSARVYDVADLLVRVPNFSGPRISLREQVGNNTAANSWNGVFGDDDEDDDDDEDAYSMARREQVDNLLDLIRACIAPETWRNGPAAGTIGSVRELNGQLIVTQTKENHRSLTHLLQQLREARVLAPHPIPGCEALFTAEGRLSEWAAGLLARAREGKLSKFSSVVVRKAAGRTFACIAGVWLDTALTARENAYLIRPASPAAEAILKAKPELKPCFGLGPSAVFRAAAGAGVCPHPAGLAKADHPEVVRLIKALSK